MSRSLRACLKSYYYTDYSMAAPFVQIDGGREVGGRALKGISARY